MPKVQCRCGFIMRIHTLEEDFVYELISDNDLWNIIDTWSENEKFTSEDFLSAFNSKSFEVYKCPSCERLYIEESPGSCNLNGYIKET
ncbi:hypothetical protein [Snodgrassella alvi]|jgi:hypothetical protein|nr:hypothetical protein [Snodgrassella alvi]PIT13562.1 hypothetical protein BGI30_01240 [Snodgrassella alvi]